MVHQKRSPTVLDLSCRERQQCTHGHGDGAPKRLRTGRPRCRNERRWGKHGCFVWRRSGSGRVKPKQTKQKSERLTRDTLRLRPGTSCPAGVTQECVMVKPEVGGPRALGGANPSVHHRWLLLATGACSCQGVRIPRAIGDRCLQRGLAPAKGLESPGHKHTHVQGPWTRRNPPSHQRRW